MIHNDTYLNSMPGSYSNNLQFAQQQKNKFYAS